MRGSIRKRGKSWEIKFDVGTINGKRQTRYKTVRGGYREAQQELTRLLSAADEHRLPAPTKATVAQYVRHGSTARIRYRPRRPSDIGNSPSGRSFRTLATRRCNG